MYSTFGCFNAKLSINAYLVVGFSLKHAAQVLRHRTWGMFSLDYLVELGLLEYVFPTHKRLENEGQYWL